MTGQKPVAAFLAEYGDSTHEPRGTIVFLTGAPEGVPFVDNHRWLRPLIAEEQLVLLTVKPVPVPYVDEKSRVRIERVTNRLVRVSAGFGYMERPTLAPILRECEGMRLDIDNEATSFVYANPVIVPNANGALPRWQRGLFIWLQRNARTLVTDLEIPANRRVELSVEAAV
ncbi:MAG: KUP/HAK/KT family potassium transporter [Vulcanimicrobiaceae bacterium]